MHKLQFGLQFMFQYLTPKDICWHQAALTLASIAAARGVKAVVEVRTCNNTKICVFVRQVTGKLLYEGMHRWAVDVQLMVS